MLDANIDKLFSIEAVLKDKKKDLSKVLLLRECKVYLFDDVRIFSEFEAMTLDRLNDNEGFGELDIEFVFENNIVNESYPDFYTKCFVIRTDTKCFIKPMKLSNHPSYSKINQNGELVIGIRYYFRNKDDVDKIIKCNSFLVEGFIALGKPKNVFGLMCQLQKNKENWEIGAAYTYKPKYARNIKWLID